MTSRFSLLAGAVSLGLIWAGCSSPADGEIEDPPTSPPPGYVPGGGGQTAAAGTGGAPATAGTGGAPATAGTGGAPATAGTGGAPAAAGTGGTGGAPSAIPTGTGNLLMHDAAGWIAGSTNGLGVQGSFYTISDSTGTPPGDTTVTLGDLATPTSTCASGVASQVQTPTGGMPDYTRYWGGGVALNLADPGGGAATLPWSRGAVTGFSFNITGPMIPASLRFQAATPAGGTIYCLNDTAPGANTVQLGTLVSECYNVATPGPALPAATALESLQWQVVTAPDASTPFDFCIENLTAITTP